MDVVFLLDFDNTLCDNDLARERLADATLRILGGALADEYWTAYERVRDELGYVDFLETHRRFHQEHPGLDTVALDRAVLDFDYADVRYPATLRVLEALWRVGTVVVLSDGDPVFQPLKISRSGVHEAMRGNVIVVAHKEARLDDVALLYPAERYVAVDDKAAILARIKVHWGERVRTVHVLQGKYADDPYDAPRPDAVIGGIGDLVTLVGTSVALRVFVEDASIRGPRA